MPSQLPLLTGNISIEDALESEENILQRLRYPQRRFDFYLHLLRRRHDIAAIVSHHLGLNAEECTTGEPQEWISGSFNVCIPVYVNQPWQKAEKRVIIRFPLPYKVGEEEYPGNAEEKLRCEIATYVWLRENYPTVPIPRLWGFGFPNGLSFTDPENASIRSRLVWSFRRLLGYIFRYPLSCRYIPHQCLRNLGVGYMVIEYIEPSEGTMLLRTWEEHRHDNIRRKNFFRDLSRIMLTLARIPLPQIASFRIDDQGLIHLDNRPLTLRLQHIENEGIPTNIDRKTTYPMTEPYVLDLIACHDNIIRFKPNSVKDEWDGRAQQASLATMRMLVSHFLQRDLRNGPFVLTLTDLSLANIMVDDDWHVKCIVDLEWACSLPVEMLHPPWWLSGRPVDGLSEGENLDAYGEAHREFMECLEEQEELFPPVNGTPSFYTHIMRQGWEIRKFFYFQAIDDPKGLYRIFLQHIQPRFEKAHLEDRAFDRIMSSYWATDASAVVSKKLEDKVNYDNALRAVFEKQETKETLESDEGHETESE